MNRWLPRRTAILVLVALPALCIGWRLHTHWRAARLEMARAEAAVREIEDRINAANDAREALQREIMELRFRKMNTLLAVKQAEAQLTNAAPEDRWIAPSSGAPEWASGQPYIWLHKETLKGIRTRSFLKSGELTDEMANTLALKDEQRRSVNGMLRSLVLDYRNLEAAKAERDETPPTKEGDSPRITVKIPAMPEEGARLKQQMQAALEREIGGQRAEMLMSMGASWFSQELNDFGREPRSVSAKRYADGTYGVNVGYSSMRGAMKLEDHLPGHLASFFEALPQAPSR